MSNSVFLCGTLFKSMLKQQLNFKLSQKLSPQQIQLMKLIQLPTQAFEQRVKQELEENPALDSGKEEIKDDFEEFDNSTDDQSIDYITYGFPYGCCISLLQDPLVEIQFPNQLT